LLIWLTATAAIVLGVLALGRFALRKAENPDAIWLAGQEYLKAGRIDLAETASNRLGRIREPTLLDHMLKAQLDIALGLEDSAVEELMRIPDQHVMAPQAQLMAGQVELRRHRARFAEEHFRKATQLDPQLVQAHRELIYILGFQLRRKELNAEFLALSRITELTFENVFHWCLMRTALWEPATALEELLRFVQADPDDRWSRLAIADNYRRMGLLDDAENIIARLPNSDVDALALRVMLAVDRHEDDEARQLLEIGPATHPLMAKLRGRLALAEHDGPRAVRLFRLAYKELPDDRDALFGLINALTLVGDERSAAPLREAARNFEMINSVVQRAANPKERESIKLLHELGAACAAAGRYPEARAWYRVAISRDPLDIEAQQALYQVERRMKAASPAFGTEGDNRKD
jgi:tetratricopeptide (TPR) repeat protein